MRRWTSEEFSGLAMLVVAVAVGAPALLGAIDTSVPRAVWGLIFTVSIVALSTTPMMSRSSPLRYVVFAVGLVASWTALATASSAGLLPILLVIAAALSVYVAPPAVGFTVAALNTVVLAILLINEVGAGVETAMTVGFYLLIQLATLLSSLSLLREQRMRRELAEAHVDLQAAAVLLAESSRTAERLRISRDLHDLIGHQLTVLTLELEAAKHRDGSGVREHIERADRVARELLSDVRATVGELRFEPSNLCEALEQVVRDVPGLDVSVDVAPDVTVDEERSAAFVRAVQEIVTNTVRHADARELRISVSRDGESVALLAVDDGTGSRNLRPGNGLRGLRERFEHLGGRVSFDGSRGFRVTAQVPVP